MGRLKTSKAFALPTVLIASIVLLMILAVSVTATATVRTALKNQYYVQLAQVAGESGVAYAKACLAANGNVPQWSDAKPLTPSTDCSGNSILSPTVRTLVVAGGGGGGGNHGGGGGAGGVVYEDTSTIANQSYPVVVGGGGSPGASASAGGKGNTSSFNTTSAIGGGGGGSRVSTGAVTVAGTGGSGGGGAGTLDGSTGHAGYGASGTTGQGGAGGNGTSDATAGNGGGGGGAGADGGDATGSGGAGVGATGAGGNGLAYSITGSSIYYGGGGSGGHWGTGAVGASGLGGGGAGGGADGAAGTAGAANTGGGGGGSGGGAAGGGAGGSGVVIISYPINSGIAATGGSITTSGNYKIHKFTSSGTFNVTNSGSSSCPSDPRCSVTVNGNVRSSFSVPKPTVDANGKALTIPNSGYVNVLRTSNGAVWRTYQQPSVQAAVVPDLCSGNATSARGWSAAVKTTQQDSIPSASTAQTISLADGFVNPGVMYFRRDFNVSKPGTYDLNVYTSSAQDNAVSYIDGSQVSSTAGSLDTDSVALTAGCHTLVVQLTNASVVARASDFTASLTGSGASGPVVVTDASWRVSAGDPVHFSETNYYEAPNSWESANVLGVWSNTSLPWSANVTSWGGVSGDPLTQWTTSNANGGGSAAPASSSILFRDSTPFTLSAASTVRVTTSCDDACDLYLDGNLVFTNTSASQSIISKSITIQPGVHTFGLRLKNNNAGYAAFLFSAVNLSDNNKVLSRSNVDWDVNTSWSTSVYDSYSFDNTFLPTPVVLPAANVRALVVGGGGSGGGSTGGGGGAGGVIYNAALSLSPGSYSVSVGAGAPATPQQTQGSSGSNSSFAGIVAYGGGGGGASTPSSAGVGGLGGGSGGGGQSYAAVLVPGPGVSSQGNDGGTGTASNTGVGGGGGGAGASPGAGAGGIGIQSNITGSMVYYGGGGGGGGNGNGGAGGNGGGGAGATTAGVAGSPNTGGGGGGGFNHTGGSGGAGGSGVVIIAFPTGSMTVTTTGATKSVVGGFDIYRFTTSGSFTIVSIN